jgi:hypothetical protein
MPNKGSIAGFGGGLEDNSSYFSFTSFVTPRRIYEIDLTNLKTKIFWEEDLKGYRLRRLCFRF